jgi:hypothetical protein
MGTVTLRCAVLALPFLFACTPSARQPGGRADACSPSYLRVARTSEELETLTVSVSALLIGCKRDLGALTASERTLLHNSLQEAAAEEHFHIMLHESAEVREVDPAF